MSTVRRDIFTGCFVIISQSRAARPIGFRSSVECADSTAICPFCPGNEGITPFELYKDNIKWNMRSFHNKYPALTNDIDENTDNIFYGAYDGCGEHEVFVDTRSHDENIYDFSESHIANLLFALKSRYEYYSCMDKTKYVQVFKNSGAKAGASQKHSHWQIVSGRFVPLVQESIGTNLYNYKLQNGKCLYCELIEAEAASKERLIYEDGHLVVLAPYASRFTYETWIVPRNHYNTFSELTKRDIDGISAVLKSLLFKLKSVTVDLNFNIILMDSPKTKQRPLFHWHIQVLPRMGTLAGYEFSTGSYINHIEPEKAASILRL